MHAIPVAALFFLALVGPSVAQPEMQKDPVRQEWLLCQSGSVERCSRLLQLPLDEETRQLVEVDLLQARERQNAQIRALLQVCKERMNVRACDRALSYRLPAADRTEILEVRKAVAYRGKSVV